MNVARQFMKNRKLVVSALTEFVAVFAIVAALDWFLLAFGFFKSRPGELTVGGIAKTTAPIAIGMLMGTLLRRFYSRSRQTPAVTIPSGEVD